jgi:hypothetical protein
MLKQPGMTRGIERNTRIGNCHPGQLTGSRHVVHLPSLDGSCITRKREVDPRTAELNLERLEDLYDVLSVVLARGADRDALKKYMSSFLALR